jgi:hypothetical protein
LPGGLATSQPSRVQGTYVKDKGYFYRMTARFTVKETGEALDFDYVVACNIRLTRWRDGGLSNDSTFSPRVMVKATAGGQAVMLKTFYACNGITSDRGALPGPWGYDYPDNGNVDNPDIGRYVSACYGYKRRKMPDVIGEKVRALWPPERPRFWTVPNKDDSKIANLLDDPSVTSPPGMGGWSRRFGHPGTDQTGMMPVRSGRTVGLPPHAERKWPAETYPALWPPMTSAHPLTVEPPSAPRDLYVHKLDFREGALNGFAACRNRQDDIGLRIAKVDPGWRKKTHVFLVGDQVVRRIDDGQIYMLQPRFVVERDEYIFSYFSVGL